MGNRPSRLDAEVSHGELKQIDAICDAFETAWKREGGGARIEDYLPRVSDSMQPELLRELLMLCFELESDAPNEASLLARFSRWPAAVRQACSDHDRRSSETFGTHPGVWDTKDGESTGSAPVGPPEIEGFELIGSLGQGGMGLVYRARQISLNRDVAIKVLTSGLASRSMHDRLRLEAEILAQLRHKNIVQVFGVGEWEGLPYIVLELIEGGSMSRWIDGKPRPVRDAAGLLETISRAVHAAHLKGVIHRDLKPSNVLLEEDGTPKVSDFGLAKEIYSDSGATRSGEVLGTPSYMPPEQAAGRVAEIGPASDVHALGAMLFEALTGRPPFQGATVWDTVQQVLRTDPVPPRRLQPKIPLDLQTICLKCLEKSPAARYHSALELADDLRRFLDNRPILARPAGWLVQTSKFARRRPSTAALLAAVPLLAAVGLAAIAFHNQKLRREKEIAEENAAAATEQAEGLLDTLDQMVLQAQTGRTPGGERRLGELLLQQALGDMEKVHQRFLERSDRLDASRIDALLKIGRIYQTTGRSEEAGRAFREAVEAATTLAEASPDDWSTQRRRADCLHHLGAWSESRSDLVQAEREFKQQLSLERQLLQTLPPEFAEARPARLESLAKVHENLGDVCFRSSRTPEALQSYLASLQACRELVKLRDDFVSRDRLGDALIKVADARRDLFDLEGARELVVEARGIREALMKDERTNKYRASMQLSMALDRSALIERDSGNVRLAYAHATAAEKLVGRCREFDPFNVECASDWAKSCVLVSQLAEALEQPDVALAMARQAVAEGERLARQDSSNVSFQRVWADARSTLGVALSSQGKQGLAAEQFREAGELLRRVAAGSPSDHRIHRDIAVTCDQLGHVLADLGQLDDAERSYRESLEICTRLREQDASSALAQRDFAGCLANLASVESQRGEHRESMLIYQQSVEAFRRAAAEKDNWTAQFDWILVLEDLGDELYQTWQLKEAQDCYAEAAEACRAAIVNRQGVELADAERRLPQLQRKIAHCGVLRDVPPLDLAGGEAEAVELAKQIRAAAQKAAPQESAAQQLVREQLLGGAVAALDGGKPVAVELLSDALRRQRALWARAAAPEGADSESAPGEAGGRAGERRGEWEAAVAANERLRQLRRDPPPALRVEWLEHAVTALQRLAEGDPNNSQIRQRLAEDAAELAALLNRQGDRKTALLRSEQSLEMRRWLAAQAPEEFDAQWRLAVSLTQHGGSLMKDYQFEAAHQRMDEALRLTVQLAQHKSERAAAAVAKIDALMANERTTRLAAATVRHGDDVALAAPPRQRSFLLQMRIQLLLHQLRPAEASKSIDTLISVSHDVPGGLLDAAFLLSQCINAVRQQAAKGAVSEAAAAEEVERYGQRAVDLLRRLHAQSFFDEPARVEEVERNAGFQPLRGREDYRQWLRRVKNND